MELDRQFGCRKQPSPYFQLLMKLHCCGFWSLKISFNMHFYFITSVFWVKTFQKFECRNARGHYQAILLFVGWILLGKGCFPVCNKLCVQQGPVGPRGPQGLQGKQVSVSPQGISLARAEGKARSEWGLWHLWGSVRPQWFVWLNAPSSRREFKQGLCSRWTQYTGIGSKRAFY